MSNRKRENSVWRREVAAAMRRGVAATMCGLLMNHCGGPTTVAGRPSETPPPRIAGEATAPTSAGSPATPPPAAEQREAVDLPYGFTPMSHAPIFRTVEAYAPDPASLPPLVMRLDKCFAHAKKPETEKRPQLNPSTEPKPTAGPVYIPAPHARSTETAAAKPTPSAAPPAPQDMGTNFSASFEEMSPEYESAPVMAQAPPQRDGGERGHRHRLSREERRERREEKREARREARAEKNANKAAGSEAVSEQPAAAEGTAWEADDSRAANNASPAYNAEAVGTGAYKTTEEIPRRPAPQNTAPKRIASSEVKTARLEAAPEPEPAVPSVPPPEPEPNPDMAYDDWGRATYLSNDDSMSLSSAQRIIYAVDHSLPLPEEYIRPHELLNYFSFITEDGADGFDFSVAADLEPDPKEKGIFTLGLAVKGRPMDEAHRRNAVLTLVVDRSGSMKDEGRMDYLRRGLLRMMDELKTGDMVHLVVFDREVCVPMENFVVGRDRREDLEKAIRAVKPRGATDLYRGLSKGYEIADRTYRRDASNRVVLITDAQTNKGVTDERIISMIAKYYDDRSIRLSGIGVGREFNDSLLDKLTERGKGAYVFLGSEAEVDAVFGTRFISLIETTAVDVRFLLHLPPSLRLNTFYGEQSSSVKEDVQEIHYFANTSQLFLSDLMARSRTLRPEDHIMLTVEYKDPESEVPLTEEVSFQLGSILYRNSNVEKGRLIMTFANLLADSAARVSAWSDKSEKGRSILKEEELRHCAEGGSTLSDLATASTFNLREDPEVRRVLGLFRKYCERFTDPE